MDLGLKDKAYIVTGGARGIGEAISKAIAAEGGKVIIAGRNENDNARLVETIVQAGGQATAIAAELGLAACSDNGLVGPATASRRTDVVLCNWRW